MGSTTSGSRSRRSDIERAAELFELLGFERVEPPPTLAEYHLARARGHPGPPDAEERADRPSPRPPGRRRPRLRGDRRTPARARLRGRTRSRALGRAASPRDRPRRSPGRADGRTATARRELEATRRRRPAARSRLAAKRSASAKPSRSSTVAPSAGNIAKPVAAETGRCLVAAEAAAGRPGRAAAPPLPPPLRRWPRGRSPRTRRRPGGRPSPRPAPRRSARAPISASRRSPSRWPKRSLTALKPSRSSRIRANSRRVAPVAGDFLGQALVQAAVVADAGQLVAAGQRPERVVAGAQPPRQQHDRRPRPRPGRRPRPAARISACRSREGAEHQRQQQPGDDRGQRRRRG